MMTSNFLNLKTPMIPDKAVSPLWIDGLSCRVAGLVFEQSVAHEKRAVAHLGESGIMSHYDYGLAQTVAQFEEKFVKIGLGSAVEIT